jgi:hypothetical protein
MEAVYYTKQNKEYIVTKCTENDIDAHYDLLKDLVADTDKTIYKTQMKHAIEQGLALKTDGAFLYVHKVINTWLGDSIYGKDLVGLALVMKELVAITGDISIKFNPHEGLLPTMKTLMTKKSIRLKYNGNGYVRVSTKEVQPKFAKLLKYYGIEK